MKITFSLNENTVKVLVLVLVLVLVSNTKFLPINYNILIELVSVIFIFFSMEISLLSSL
jgi:hypothetical protein